MKFELFHILSIIYTRVCLCEWWMYALSIISLDNILCCIKTFVIIIIFLREQPAVMVIVFLAQLTLAKLACYKTFSMWVFHHVPTLNDALAQNAELHSALYDLESDSETKLAMRKWWTNSFWWKFHFPRTYLGTASGNISTAARQCRIAQLVEHRTKNQAQYWCGFDSPV